MKRLWLAILLLVVLTETPPIVVWAANTHVQITQGSGGFYFGCVTDSSSDCHNTFVGSDGSNPLQYWAINSSGQLAIQAPPGQATATNQSTQITQETTTATGVGTPADTAYSGSGSASIIAALKGVYSLLTGTLKVAGTGTAGTPNTGVVTVQGIASGTTVPVADSALLSAIQADPCGGAKTTVAISQATSTQIITGTSSKKTYVCSFTVVGSDAEDISLISGTGSVCASTQVAFIGSTTAANGMAFAANGGVSMGSGLATTAGGAIDTAANNVCLLQSGTGRVSGVITYVQQ